MELQLNVESSEEIKFNILPHDKIFQQLKYANLCFDSLRNVKFLQLVQETIHTDGFLRVFQLLQCIIL